MTRGKHAASAAIRRAEAAHEHIDRLTEQLADLKLRCRRAEASAVEAEGLRQRVKTLEKQIADDSFVAELRDRLDLYRDQTQWLIEYHKDLHVSFVHAARDAVEAVSRNATTTDIMEFIHRRYTLMTKWWIGPRGVTGPAFGKGARVQRDSEIKLGRPYIHTPDEGLFRRFTDDEVRRLQQAQGKRVMVTWAPDRDLADVAIDMLDAARAGFKGADIYEYVTGESPA